MDDKGLINWYHNTTAALLGIMESLVSSGLTGETMMCFACHITILKCFFFILLPFF